MDRQSGHITRRGALRLACGALAGAAFGGHGLPAPARALMGGVGDGEPVVLVNRVGYRPGAPVRLLLAHGREPFSGSLDLVEAAGRRVIATFDLDPPRRDAPSGHFVSATLLKEGLTPGRYRAVYAGVESAEIAVDEAVHDALMESVLRSLHLERCGVALFDPVSGFHRRPCHRDDVSVGEEEIYASGGWHLGASYDKDAAVAARTVLGLLMLMRRHGKRAGGLVLNIPESGNARPDLLDEALIGLDWLLRLQRPSGAVHAGVFSDSFPASAPLPHDDTSVRRLAAPNGEATALAAAAFSEAAHVLAETEPDLARHCANAALSAWRALQQERMPPPRAASLLLASQAIAGPRGIGHDNAPFTSAARARLDSGAPLEMETVLAFLAFLNEGGAEDDSLAEEIHARLIAEAEALTGRASDSAYGFALKHAGRDMASDLIAAALILRAAARDDGGAAPAFMAAAQDQLDILLGRNPLDLSFVTGFGGNSPQNPAHALSQASGIVAPGLLVAGPDAQGDPEPGVSLAGDGLLAYADSARARATNAPRTDRSALFALLLAEMAASDEAERMDPAGADAQTGAGD